MERAKTIITAAFLIILTSAYTAYIVFEGASLSIASAIMSAALLVLFGYACKLCISLVLDGWQKRDPRIDERFSRMGKRTMRPAVTNPIFKMFFVVLLSRIAVYVVMYILSMSVHGYEGGLLNNIHLWLKGDAPHYMNIAENGYMSEGDDRVLIVFFPMYPIMVRALTGIFGSYLASGLFVSNIAAALSGYLMYKLVLLDYSPFLAKRAVKYLFLLPAAFLLCAPMSDSLFLLFSLWCFYLLRKKYFFIACAVGALASFTRIHGVLLIAPVLVEMIRELLRERRRGRYFALEQVARFSAVLVIPMGLLTYLYINYTVTGNAFQFLIHQSEHWSQSLGWFFNTAAYQSDLFFETRISNPAQAYGLWLPNLLYIFAGIAIMLYAMRDPYPPMLEGDAPAIERDERPLRASYAVYFLVYFFISVGATWLLSAPRYLTCAFPLAIAVARLTKHRTADYIVTGTCIILQILYMLAYVQGWPVY